MAKRPPSSCTIGRSSGGITGTTSRIMASGSLTRWPCVVARLNAETILRPLDRLLLALGRQRALALRRVDGGLELLLLLVEVDAVDERLDGVGAHAALEVLAVAVLQLPPQHLVLDDLAGEEVVELVPDALEEVELGSRTLADRPRVLLGGLLAGLDVGVLGAVLLELRDLVLELLEALGMRSSSRSFSIASFSASISFSRLGRSSWRRSSSTQVTRLAAK